MDDKGKKAVYGQVTLQDMRRENVAMEDEQHRLQQALEDQALATEQQIRSMAAMSDEARQQAEEQHDQAVTQLLADHQTALNAAEKALLKSEASNPAFLAPRSFYTDCNQIDLLTTRHNRLHLMRKTTVALVDISSQCICPTPT